MKNSRFVFLSVLLAVSYLLIACGAALLTGTEAQQTNAGGVKVEFVGPIEAITGRQWVVNGQIIQLRDPALLNRNFQADDSVHVNAIVYSDGSVKIERIEVYRVFTK